MNYIRRGPVIKDLQSKLEEKKFKHKCLGLVKETIFCFIVSQYSWGYRDFMWFKICWLANIKKLPEARVFDSFYFVS